MHKCPVYIGADAEEGCAQRGGSEGYREDEREDDDDENENDDDDDRDDDGDGGHAGSGERRNLRYSNLLCAADIEMSRVGRVPSSSLSAIHPLHAPVQHNGTTTVVVARRIV
eukprot:GHVU01182550.1.p5 GENE.GHVU01182550.1~~GHVU01182550.1.p5  ORF type:complete len:112 (+),score=19.38 GHVU01182550.1:4077-4412(+)